MSELRCPRCRRILQKTTDWLADGARLTVLDRYLACRCGRYGDRSGVEMADRPHNRGPWNIPPLLSGHMRALCAHRGASA
jgi:hypothetical protein